MISPDWSAKKRGARIASTREVLELRETIGLRESVELREPLGLHKPNRLIWTVCEK